MPKTTAAPTNLDFEVVDPSEVPEGRPGRGQLSPASLALLEGKTIFMGGRNRAARFASMAKPRGFKVRTRAGKRGGAEGVYIWLEAVPPDAEDGDHA